MTNPTMIPEFRNLLEKLPIEQEGIKSVSVTLRGDVEEGISESVTIHRNVGRINQSDSKTKAK